MRFPLNKPLLAVLTSLILTQGGWTQLTWAQEDTDSPSSDIPRTGASMMEVPQELLTTEKIGVKPQLGWVTYNDQLGQSATNALYGFTAEMNALPYLSPSPSQFYLGPSIGFYFSHLGSPTSNFFGTNPNMDTGNAGANLLLFPINLKAGYNLTPSIRVAAHGGGNLTYRSIANSMQVGTSSVLSGDAWRMFPNVGLDGEFLVFRNMAVLLRPDLTFTPGNNLFSATAGVTFLLG